jgi:hypothetical protein
MIKKFITYLRYFAEPDGKSLRAEAFESAKRHYANTKPTAEAFVAYQIAYVRSYREKYAKAKLCNTNVT